MFFTRRQESRSNIDFRIHTEIHCIIIITVIYNQASVNEFKLLRILLPVNLAMAERRTSNREIMIDGDRQGEVVKTRETPSPVLHDAICVVTLPQKCIGHT